MLTAVASVCSLCVCLCSCLLERLGGESESGLRTNITIVSSADLALRYVSQCVGLWMFDAPLFCFLTVFLCVCYGTPRHISFFLFISDLFFFFFFNTVCSGGKICGRVNEVSLALNPVMRQCNISVMYKGKLNFLFPHKENKMLLMLYELNSRVLWDIFTCNTCICLLLHAASRNWKWGNWKKCLKMIHLPNNSQMFI